MRRALVLICLLPLLLTVTVRAEETALDKVEAETREGLLAILPDVARPYVSDPTDSDALKETLGFKSLFILLANSVTESGGALSREMLAIFTVSLLFGALSLFTANSGISVFMQSAASLSLFALLYDSVTRTLGFFSDLSALASGLSPLLTAIFAAGGATATAAMTSGGFAAFLSVLTLFSSTLLPPLLRILFALALLSSLGNHTLIRELSRRLSGIATLLFSILSMLLLASLAFQSALAASSDSVALRTVKYTASSAVPLVGGTLSGALGALTASLSLLRSALGGTAVIAVLCLLLPPLIELFLLRFALSLSESVATYTEASALREILARYQSIMDLALAALVIVSILFLLMLGVLVGLSPFGG